MTAQARPVWPAATPGSLGWRRALAYAVDSGPIWLVQCVGVGRVLLTLAPIYVAGVAVFDDKTGKVVPMDDLPDAADLALCWVPSLCVWALVQALAIDLLGSSFGMLAAGLGVKRVDGGATTRARLIARDFLRIAPAAAGMAAAGVLASLDAQSASFWVLAGGLALAFATAACNAAAVLRGGRPLLDGLAGTSVCRAERGPATI